VPRIAWISVEMPFKELDTSKALEMTVEARVDSFGLVA
jgi:hypothetical protein